MKKPVIEKETLVFVNGGNEKCGCTCRFSDGHGEYADVFYITLCEKHRAKTIQDVEVPHV